MESKNWNYKILDAGVWIDPPDPLEYAHPDERARIAAALIWTIVRGPVLIRTYEPSAQSIENRLRAAAQPFLLYGDNPSESQWIDVLCNDRSILSILLSSWGIEKPSWLCVAPHEQPANGFDVLHDRIGRIMRSLEEHHPDFALPPVQAFPDDHLLAYAIDEYLVFARPSPAVVIAAMEQIARVEGYTLHDYS